MEKRKLGRLNESILPLGLGCAAIGGYYTRSGRVASRGEIDDQESIRAIHAALSHGIRLFDVANIYGAGHAERILGQALRGQRDKALLQVKFGASFDEVTRTQIDYEGEVTPAMIRASLEGSLRRLQTDYIDIFQFQIAEYPLEQIPPLIDFLEQLVVEGKIRSISFGTPRVEAAALFAASPHCATIITGHNLLMDVPEMLDMLDEADVALLAGIPLFLGFLSGKYTANHLFSKEDLRASVIANTPNMPQRLQTIAELKPLLTAGGRSMVQGALAWLWGRHRLTIPLPGFKTADQVEELVGALNHGPLSSNQIKEIGQL
ncbi:MAG: aldo/keto reductase [Chloroflexota bacterium]